ncbi:TetR family transcriptional regulator [Cryobacterium sp. PAMC25264]|uniref:TetR family transcriptional regulator n=1 Tax=Cryobacterium sp. PAMC25264 TaxID=2861288 RepID=UPI001C62F76C|nr:TetR family transcriptional regulator [Cryobacterium sp. PAMC25264]QYF74501.1 TetR/AcrR family transcriptional regulator [Cryobacterium sp. PAMC25264]
MGRWEPDARGRLSSGAFELFVERGFDQTTALDIAQRAGLTERTFFRHFPDKREVLFEGLTYLQDAVVHAIQSAPEGLTAIDTVGSAMESAVALFGDRNYARTRATIVAANASLQERELHKVAGIAAAAAEALRHRGVDPMTADLAAEVAVTVFKIGFYEWIAPEAQTNLPACIRGALQRLKDVTAGR